MENTDLPSLPTVGFTHDWVGVISFLITVGLPIVVGLVTKQSWPASWKGALLLLLSAVKVVAEGFIRDGSAGLGDIIYATVINFIVAVVLYFGLIKETSLVKAAQRSGVKD